MFPNPFDLSGPQFLVFYPIFALCVFGVMFGLRRWLESAAGQPEARLTDAYDLAYVAGGRAHLIRVATLSLLDRELLDWSEKQIHTVAPDRITRVSNPLDRAILQEFVTASPVAALFYDGPISEAAEAVGDRMRAEGLSPSERQVAIRKAILWIGVLLVGGVGAIKIFVAFARGRFNVEILLLLMLAAPILVMKLWPSPRTPRGEATLRHARRVLDGLRQRGESLRQNQSNDELTLLAAVFGLDALPGWVAGMMSALQLRPKSDANWTGSSCGASSCGFVSAGSSCGGGGSSCGGSSCGGGGCGGGCGGCGGG